MLPMDYSKIKHEPTAEAHGHDYSAGDRRFAEHRERVRRTTADMAREAGFASSHRLGGRRSSLGTSAAAESVERDTPTHRGTFHASMKTPRDLANDTEGLVHRTYAHMPPTIQGELACDHFLQALLPDELRIQTLLAHPKSLQEALELATERELLCAGAAKPLTELTRPPQTGATGGTAPGAAEPAWAEGLTHFVRAVTLRGEQRPRRGPRPETGPTPTRIRETTWGLHNRDDAGPWGCVPTSCSGRNNPAQGPWGCTAPLRSCGWTGGAACFVGQDLGWQLLVCPISCEWTMLLSPGGYRVFSDSFKT
ncbi:cytochrome c heme-lyase [Sarotherodon galilaeus]